MVFSYTVPEVRTVLADDHRKPLAIVFHCECPVILSGYHLPFNEETLAGWVRTDDFALTHRGQVVNFAWINVQPRPTLHEYSEVCGDFRASECSRWQAHGYIHRIVSSDPLVLHAALGVAAVDHLRRVLAMAKRIAS